MERIIKEKISADHLLYVSLKYTKTCDVIMNLLLRWRRMIEISFDELLEENKKLGKIKEIPANIITKLNELKRVYKNNKPILDTIKFFMMLRKLEQLQCTRVGEFRKNVALKIQFAGKEVNVDLEQLKIYSKLMEDFIGEVKKVLMKK